MSAPANQQPTVPNTLRADSRLREALLNYYLETYTGPELTDWLRGLGQDTKGSVSDKQQRIRSHTKYLSIQVRQTARGTLP